MTSTPGPDGANLPSDQGATSELELDLPEVSPELKAMFDATDRLFDDIPEEGRMGALEHFYFDADGQPQIRTQRVRLVNGQPD